MDTTVLTIDATMYVIDDAIPTAPIDRSCFSGELR